MKHPYVVFENYEEGTAFHPRTYLEDLFRRRDVVSPSGMTQQTEKSNQDGRYNSQSRSALDCLVIHTWRLLDLPERPYVCYDRATCQTLTRPSSPAVAKKSSNPFRGHHATLFTSCTSCGCENFAMILCVSAFLFGSLSLGATCARDPSLQVRARMYQKTTHPQLPNMYESISASADQPAHTACVSGGKGLALAPADRVYTALVAFEHLDAFPLMLFHTLPYPEIGRAHV